MGRTGQCSRAGKGKVGHCTLTGQHLGTGGTQTHVSTGVHCEDLGVFKRVDKGVGKGVMEG